MQQLIGSTDLTLCNYLLTLQSHTEIAEVIQAQLGSDKSDARLSEFTAQFIKRKDAAEAALAKKSGGKSKKKKAGKNAQ